MKLKIRFLTILVAISTFLLMFSRPVTAQPAMNLQIFYDQLSPYGQWVDYANYGYVWLPDAGPDFVPYSSNGHWVYTDYGWTWASSYEWGWAPFHYGRWNFDNYYGWFWIPDTEWAPAWVSWRRAEGYYGWEPLGYGMSFSVSFDRLYNNQNDHWLFVRDRDFDRQDMNHFYAARSENERIGRGSKIINTTYFDNRRHSTYSTGPNRDDLQRSIGRRVTSYAVMENNKPGQDLNNGQLHIYRPVVARTNDNGQRAVPTRVVNVKKVKQPANRRDANQPGNLNKTDYKTNDRRPPATTPKFKPVTPSEGKPVSPARNNAGAGQTRSSAAPAQHLNTNPVRRNNNVQKQNNEVIPSGRTESNQQVNKTNVQQQGSVTPSANQRQTVQRQNTNSSVKGTNTVKTKTARPVRPTKKATPKKQETLTQDIKQ